MWKCWFSSRRVNETDSGVRGISVLLLSYFLIQSLLIFILFSLLFTRQAGIEAGFCKFLADVCILQKEGASIPPLNHSIFLAYRVTIQFGADIYGQKFHRPESSCIPILQGSVTLYMLSWLNVECTELWYKRGVCTPIAP